MKKIWIIGIILGFCNNIYADNNSEKSNVQTENPTSLSAEAFLARVRRPPLQESWTQMEGTIAHKRRDQEMVSHPLYLALRFAPMRTYGQLVLADNEFYTITQAYHAGKEASSITALNPKSTNLGKYGVKANDLTLSFLYWKFANELDRGNVAGQECRVMELWDENQTEYAKVWISAEHCFPLKVEWYKKGEKERYRSLEIAAFAKQNDYYLISELILEGPGWRTRIEFTKRDAGTTENGIPTNLFKKYTPTQQ